jgi:hypothetical protein
MRSAAVQECVDNVMRVVVRGPGESKALFVRVPVGRCGGCESEVDCRAGRGVGLAGRENGVAERAATMLGISYSLARHGRLVALGRGRPFSYLQ